MISKYRVPVLFAALITFAAMPVLAQEPAATPTAATTEKAEPAAKARVQVTPMEFDFGEVWEGEPAEGEFTVKNVGDAPLTVKLKSSCGCTVVSKPKTPLDPGESSTFTITYATNRIGKASKMVKVMTNDADQKQLRIPVRGTVKQLFEMKPHRSISFNQLEETDRKTKTIVVTNRYEKPLKLKLVEDQNTELPYLDLRLDKRKEGQEYALVVSTKPPLPFGLKRVEVLLETDQEGLPQIKVPVSLTVRPRVAISPVRVFIPRKSAPARQATFRITYKKGANIKVKGARLGDRELEIKEFPQVEPAPTAQSEFIRFEVTLPPSDEIIGKKPKLTILTEGDPDFTELEVVIVRRGVKKAGAGAVPTGARKAKTKPVPPKKPTPAPKPE